MISGDRVVVTGTDNVAGSVLVALHQQGVAATRLRVDQPNLDDAFIALTREQDATRGPAAAQSDTNHRKCVKHRLGASREQGFRRLSTHRSPAHGGGILGPRG